MFALIDLYNCFSKLKKKVLRSLLSTVLISITAVA